MAAAAAAAAAAAVAAVQAPAAVAAPAAAPRQPMAAAPEDPAACFEPADLVRYSQLQGKIAQLQAMDVSREKGAPEPRGGCFAWMQLLSGWCIYVDCGSLGGPGLQRLTAWPGTEMPRAAAY